MHPVNDKAQRRPEPALASRRDESAGRDPVSGRGGHPTFWRRAALHQSRVGAVTPSSPRLAALLAAPVPRDGSPTVVELGPGTGAVSDAIAQRLSASARHLAIEIDPVMAAWLQATRDDMEVVEGGASDLRSILAARGSTAADVIVSGLPWSLFDVGTQAGTLDAIRRSLAPNGCFTTFAYTTGLWLPGARRFARLLRQNFDEVVMTAPVWRNLPPAVVYVCRRPQPSEDPPQTGATVGRSP